MILLSAIDVLQTAMTNVVTQLGGGTHMPERYSFQIPNDARISLNSNERNHHPLTLQDALNVTKALRNILIFGHRYYDVGFSIWDGSTRLGSC